MATGLERRQAEPGQQVGRPKKHEGGWKSANKWICIANKTFDKWRTLSYPRAGRGKVSEVHFFLHVL